MRNTLLASLCIPVLLAMTHLASAQNYYVLQVQPVLQKAVVFSAPATAPRSAQFDYRSQQRLDHRSTTGCFQWDRKVRQIANPELERYAYLYRTAKSTGRLKDRSLATCG